LDHHPTCTKQALFADSGSIRGCVVSRFRPMLLTQLRHRAPSKKEPRSCRDLHAKHSDQKNKARQSLESVDYDLHESRQYVEYVTNLSGPLGKVKGGFRWFYTVLAGFGAGGVAVAIQFVLKHVTEARFEHQHHMYEEGHGLLLRYLAWLTGSLVLAAVAGFLVCYIEPLAAGSGIPEIKCLLNGIELPNVLLLRTLICKAFGIVCSVAAGLPCGKEGPMIHSGAICGGQMTRAHAGPIDQPYKINCEARDFVAAGAAAGVAAAFGSPIGGCLFAVEEGATHMNPRILVRTFVCAAVGALTVRFFAGPMEGVAKWGTLGTEVPVEFGRFDNRPYQIWELAIFGVIGVLGGLAGALFNCLNTKLTVWRMQWIGPRGHMRFLEVLFVTGSIITFNFLAPLFFGGESNAMSSFSSAQKLFINLGGECIRSLFHDPENFDQRMLLFFAIVHYAQTVWTYGLGVPSGLFVPSLLGGAAFGRSLGQVLNSLDDANNFANPGVYALIGATAMLSGMARITISLAVILMETTGEAEWGLPIFLTVMAAKWTGDLFNKGIYDVHIELKHVPLLEGRPEKPMLMLQAGEIMATGVKTTPVVAMVKDVLSMLEGCKHNAFPVLDPVTKTFVGLVERNTLQHVLALCTDENLGRGGRVVPYSAMVRNGHPNFPALAQVRAAMAPKHLEKEIELAPYTNQGCYTVQGHAAAMRCYALFRTMGLRHLPVLAEDHTLRGIITRKDLLNAMEAFEGQHLRDMARKHTPESSARSVILGAPHSELTKSSIAVEEESSSADSSMQTSSV